MIKIRIKFGAVEIEYEGEEKSLNGGFRTLLKDLHVIGALPTDEQVPDKTRSSNSTTKNAKDEPHSTSTAAHKPGADNGPDLILAAAMRLTLTGSSKFTKTQIRQEMREADDSSESSYGSNFDADFKTLIGKSRITHSGGEHYSLPARELASLNARTASSEASLPA